MDWLSHPVARDFLAWHLILVSVISTAIGYACARLTKHD